MATSCEHVTKLCAHHGSRHGPRSTHADRGGVRPPGLASDEEMARVQLPSLATASTTPSIDPTTNLLFIAHMNAGVLLTFDLERRRVIGTTAVPGVPASSPCPSCTASLPRQPMSTKRSRSTGEPGGSSPAPPAGSYPDGLAYDPVERHVFVSDEAGGVETVLDAKGARIATIWLGSAAGNVQYNAGTGQSWSTCKHVTRSRSSTRPPTRSSGEYPSTASPTTASTSIRLGGSPSSPATATRSSSPRPAAFGGHSDLRRRRRPRCAGLRQQLAETLGRGRRGDVAVFTERGRSLAKLGQAHLASAAHTVAVDSRHTSCTSRSRSAATADLNF